MDAVSTGIGLDRLADVAVDVGARIAPGQRVVVMAPTCAVPLVERIVRRCYERGASLVTPVFSARSIDALRATYSDPIHLDLAPEWMWEGIGTAFAEGAARIAITGEDPFAMVGVPEEAAGKVSNGRMRRYVKALKPVMLFEVNWTMVPYASDGWARAVFPDLPQIDATQALWREVLAATRADLPDPVAAWNAHNADLRARCADLNASAFKSIRFRGPGTDLVVGLADGHRWVGGETTSSNGITCNANLPTEEVFTAPHRDRVDGVVRSTRPLAHDGTVIEGIEMRFVGGRVVDARATTGETALHALLAVDEGASRLGEVALVPDASPISRSGKLFYNTLFDENAASHVAVGKAYPKCCGVSKDDPGAMLRAGLNDSAVHVDWMIGGPDVDVDGIDDDGRVVPVMRGGAWA